MSLLQDVRKILNDDSRIEIKSETKEPTVREKITMIHFRAAGMKVGLSKLSIVINNKKFPLAALGDAPEKYKLLFLFMQTKTEARKENKLNGFIKQAQNLKMGNSK